METNQALLQDINVTGVVNSTLLHGKICEILEPYSIPVDNIKNDLKTGIKAIKAAGKKGGTHIIILHGLSQAELADVKKSCNGDTKNNQDTKAAMYQIVIQDTTENDGFEPSDNTTGLAVPFRPGALIDMLLYFAKRAKTRHTKKTYKIGPYTFNPVWLSLSKEKSKDQDIKLTEKERDILLLLLNSEDHTISREDLLEIVWGYHADTETHTTETHIYRLRQKIESDPSAPDIILTIPEGYKIQP